MYLRYALLLQDRTCNLGHISRLLILHINVCVHRNLIGYLHLVILLLLPMAVFQLTKYLGFRILTYQAILGFVKTILLKADTFVK